LFLVRSWLRSYRNDMLRLSRIKVFCYCNKLLHEADEAKRPGLANDMTTASVPAPPAGAATAPAATPPGARPRRPPGGARWRAYLPGAAGAAYLAAWVSGLAVWPVNLPLNATAAQATASYAAHPAQAATQYLLAEGLAGLLLGIVLGCAVLARGPVTRRVKGAAALGAGAVLISLTQCVIGFVLIGAATAHHAGRAGELSDLVNQLDGAKMLALAGAAACLATLGRPRQALPRWLRATTVPLAVALVASGYAYLALSQSLAWTAYASGTLLLLWVTGLGLALTARQREHGGTGR
jgi:hypothetical protein